MLTHLSTQGFRFPKGKTNRDPLGGRTSRSTRRNVSKSPEIRSPKIRRKHPLKTEGIFFRFHLRNRPWVMAHGDPSSSGTIPYWHTGTPSSAPQTGTGQGWRPTECGARTGSVSPRASVAGGFRRLGRWVSRGGAGAALPGRPGGDDGGLRGGAAGRAGPTRRDFTVFQDGHPHGKFDWTACVLSASQPGKTAAPLWGSKPQSPKLSGQELHCTPETKKKWVPGPKWLAIKNHMLLSF